MKKTLAAAITSALVIGAASTTFAAANPFSDVPTDHWSFDAVSKLAQEGVIEGYGDGTFNGNAHITRYEMAQMVAKAMAKSGTLGESDQALIDRLAAEYADELNNLGVRVAELEKKSDNVVIKGMLRLEPTREENDNGSKTTKENKLGGKLRFDITAKVNDDWSVIGRLDGNTNLRDGGTNAKGVELVRAYAQGPLFGAQAKIGETYLLDNMAAPEALVMDTEFSGAQFNFGETVKVSLNVGRIDANSTDVKGQVMSGTKKSGLKFEQIGLGYAEDAWQIGAAYYNVHGADFDNGITNAKDDKNGIWNLGFTYKFNPDVRLSASYAQSNLDVEQDDAYFVKLAYKGAQKTVPGSFGLWGLYTDMGTAAVIKSTLDGSYGIPSNAKAWAIGGNYTLDKNIVLMVDYMDGDKYSDGNSDKTTDFKKYWGRVEFYF